ncbi:MAG: hypothetical protein CME70_10800 [Halobacteriovorax sp.]|nr:hypothetical protein [Halobacteriovorax sp.]|tara:strand:- start:66120 stop:66953 length:834 start_codon:yes stop_codon:yes gene_type:complete
MAKKLILFIFVLQFSGCSFIFYQPDRVLYSRPEQFKVDYIEEWIEASDGTKLHSWYLKNKANLKKPKGLFVFFHGNAQNLSSHYANLVWLTSHGYDVFIFDYRGYGLNDGQPNQQGVHKDALAAFDHAHKLYKKIGHKKLIAYGQSLGGNIMARAFVDFPHKEDVDLLIFDSTFSSYQDIAIQKLKKFKLTYVLSPLAYILIDDRYGSYKHLSKIKRPSLVIHGMRDLVVEPEHGKYIYENLGSEEKWFWPVLGGRHIDVYHKHEKRYRKKLLKFLE